MYVQNLNPTGSLTLSALLASLPLLALLIALGGLKWRAHWAGAAALVISIVIALGVYKMPVGQALDAGVFGAALSVLAILWITFNAIWIYNLTVKTGHFAVLRRSFTAISDDRRIQSIVIAFSFGALLEALAGGGSPIAICAVMLIAIGFGPLKAAAVALVANTAPVAYGGLGNPVTILGQVTELPPETLGAMAGRQVSVLAVFVPFVLVGIVDGRRGLREVWPAALTCGLSFALAQFAFSNFVNYKLCDIFAALVSAGAVVALNRFWRRDGVPNRPVTAGGAVDDDAFTRRVGTPAGDSRADVAKAFAPYGVVVLLFSLAQLPGISRALEAPTVTFNWPGLHITSQAGKAVSVAYKLNWLSATGTLLFLSGVVTALVLGIKPTVAARTYWETLRQFGWAIVTILLVFALSYEMNLSGQISTLGLWLAQSGALFAFLSPVVGWFGVAVTGTDAGSNALFGKLQTTAAEQLHASPILFGAANTSGGVVAKMISPQNLAIGTAAVGEVGSEGVLFRRVFGWSVLFLLGVCVLVFLQSTPVLGWMRVGG
ncbi:L-lactate permease [Pseudonocardia acaciae]|uniref:L-lactate permease n=1 Tax=Pseudonocardia acaciae TaxID=551276 RepID=UPI00048D3285|nr:L-lactate permease [Pseudonocardia acaciae]